VIRALAAGDAAVLLEPASGRPAALAAAIRAAELPGVLDVIPGAATVLVTFEPGALHPDELARQADRLSPDAPRPGGQQPAIEIEVCYDGPDLPEVAAITGLTVPEVIERHQAGRYEVGWLGFSPGFGYLTGLDPVLAVVARLDTPRLAVPAGSVAIAGGLSAVYPAASPGGWRIIGRAGARLWDAERDPPALLAPGVPVRFRAVDELSPPDRPPAAPGPARLAADRGVEVLQPGPLTTVQDLGRAGLGHLGVPRSGAADAASLRAANALVGNEAGQACLEVTLGRLAVRFDGPAVVAVTGAPAPVRLTGPDGARLEPAAGTAFAVPAGTVLRLGAPPAGLRSYLAVDGGFDAPPVLGSRSADLLSGLGPSPLRAGQHLSLGAPPLGARPPGSRQPGARPVTVTAGAGRTRLPGPGAVTELRVIPGPRADWFEPGALAALTGADYHVTPASDRTGLRLAGPRLRRARTAELPSEGVAAGSLQVSHDGQPILLLADHPVTGGYPVIAVVRAADVGIAAQLRPGQPVRFQPG
jgi:KipI family sensor histidine kinase inhibitor